MRSLLHRKYTGSTNGTNFIFKLEEKFSGYLSGNGIPEKEFHSIAFSNATNAILATLIALDLKPGDKILTTPYTWGGTISGAMHLGLTILFADIHPLTLTLSPDSVESIVKDYPDIKAVIDVDIDGNPSFSREISHILKDKSIPHIIDSASGFGALYDNRPTGFYSDVVIHSFGEAKQISIGEGAILASSSRDLFEKILLCSQHPNRIARDINLDAKHPFALNFRMHPYAAYLLYSGFEDSLKYIQKRRNKIYRILTDISKKSGLNTVCSIGDGYQASFNRILLNDNVPGSKSRLNGLLNARGGIVVASSICSLLFMDPHYSAYYSKQTLIPNACNNAIDALRNVVEIKIRSLR